MISIYGSYVQDIIPNRKNISQGASLMFLLDINIISRLRLNEHRLQMKSVTNYYNSNKVTRYDRYKIEQIKQKIKNILEACADCESIDLTDVVRIKSNRLVINKKKWIKKTYQIDNKNTFLQLRVTNLFDELLTDQRAQNEVSLECQGRVFTLKYWNTTTKFSCMMLTSSTYGESRPVTQSRTFEYYELFTSSTKTKNDESDLINYYLSKKIRLRLHNNKTTEYGIVFTGKFIGEKIHFLLFFTFGGDFVYYPINNEINLKIIRETEIIFTLNHSGRVIFIFIIENDGKEYLVRHDMETNTNIFESTIYLMPATTLKNWSCNYSIHHFQLEDGDRLLVADFDAITNNITIRWINDITGQIDDTMDFVLRLDLVIDVKFVVWPSGDFGILLESITGQTHFTISKVCYYY